MATREGSEEGEKNSSSDRSTPKVDGKSHTSSSSGGLYGTLAAHAARDLGQPLLRGPLGECPEATTLGNPLFLYKALPPPNGDFSLKITKVLPEGKEGFVLLVVGQLRHDSARFQNVVSLLVTLGGLPSPDAADFMMAPPIQRRNNHGMIRLWVSVRFVDLLLSIHNKYWLGRRGIYGATEELTAFLAAHRQYLRKRRLASFPMTVELARFRPTKHRRWLSHDVPTSDTLDI